MLTCQADPHCIHPQDFTPTDRLFPQLKLDDQGRPLPTKGMQGKSEGIKQKWVWSTSELDRLHATILSQGNNSTTPPLGTIPRWKLFCLTWVGQSRQAIEPSKNRG